MQSRHADPFITVYYYLLLLSIVCLFLKVRRLQNMQLMSNLTWHPKNEKNHLRRPRSAPGVPLPENPVSARRLCLWRIKCLEFLDMIFWYFWQQKMGLPSHFLVESSKKGAISSKKIKTSNWRHDFACPGIFCMYHGESTFYIYNHIHTTVLLENKIP